MASPAAKGRARNALPGPYHVVNPPPLHRQPGGRLVEGDELLLAPTIETQEVLAEESERLLLPAERERSRRGSTRLAFHFFSAAAHAAFRNAARQRARLLYAAAAALSAIPEAAPRCRERAVRRTPWRGNTNCVPGIFAPHAQTETRSGGKVVSCQLGSLNHSSAKPAPRRQLRHHGARPRCPHRAARFLEAPQLLPALTLFSPFCFVLRSTSSSAMERRRSCISTRSRLASRSLPMA